MNTEAIKAKVQSALDSIHAVESNLGWTDDSQSAIRQLEEALSALSASAEQQPEQDDLIPKGELAKPTAQTAPVNVPDMQPVIALMRSTLSAIANTLDDGELRTAAKQAYEDSFEQERKLKLLSAAPSAPIAANSEDAKDAARYRWLRSPERGMANLAIVISDDFQPPFFELKCGEELDAAIDHAIAATAQQKEGE